LIVQYHRNYPGDPEDLVFRNQAGGPINYANMISREFIPAMDRALVGPVRFHDLRHTYAGMMISAGCNLKWLQQQMGHASITTTLDTYGHLLPGTGDEAISRLDDLVFSPGTAPGNFEQVAKMRHVSI